MEWQMQPPEVPSVAAVAAKEQQRDIDHRIQSRLLDNVKTVGGTLLWKQ
jgi:hypothetical protein